MLILPEFEFYLFDNVNWKGSHNSIGVEVDSDQASWNTDVQGQGNVIALQKSYHIAKPLDTSFEMRSEMCLEIVQLLSCSTDRIKRVS